MKFIETEKFSKLLENKGYGTAEQSADLTEILNLLAKFPNFVFGDNIDFNFTTLFINRYDIREIGAETEDLFMHFWRERAQELIVKYVPKIKMWLDNFNDLFKFTVRLSLDDTKTYGDNTENTYYLNPANQSTTNLKIQDVDKSDNSGNHHRVINRDVLQTVWGKTRADILKKIFELEDIYNSALNEFNTIFMGVL